MSKMLENISSQVGTYLPGVLTALAVLIIGWIVAKIIAMLVGKALTKTGAGAKISKLVSPGGGINASKIISKAVFYLLMIFVLITFFQVLNLPVVSEPLNAFLDQVFAYAPRVLGALGLGIVAYVLARVLKEVSKGGLQAMDIDGKIANIGKDASALTSAVGNVVKDDDGIDLSGAVDDFEEGFDIRSSSDATAGSAQLADSDDSLKLSESIPEALYWLVFALFLPGILGALQIPGLLEPIQNMYNKALEHAPNIIGAGVIFLVGGFVANLVKQIVSNLTASFGVNRAAKKIGLTDSLGSSKPSDLLGMVSFAFVLLPVMAAALDTLKIEAITKPVSSILERVTSLIPGFIGAAVVLGIAFFLGRIIAKLVEDLLGGFGFDKMPEKLGLNLSNASPNFTPSKIGGKVTLAAIVLLSLMQALPMMGLDSFAGHVNVFSAFAIRALLALVIAVAGLYLANLAADNIKASGMENAGMLASVARIAIMVFAGGFALQHVGVSATIINTAFMALLGGLGVAVAIAFGWGGRDAAKRIVDRHVK
jgi:hypothetical protein